MTIRMDPEAFAALAGYFALLLAGSFVAALAVGAIVRFAWRKFS